MCSSNDLVLRNGRINYDKQYNPYILDYIVYFSVYLQAMMKYLKYACLLGSGSSEDGINVNQASLSIYT